MARLRAAVRRAATTPENENGPLEAGDLSIDLSAKTVRRSGEEVHLTPTRWGVLALLVRNRGKLVGRKQLLREIWGQVGPEPPCRSNRDQSGPSGLRITGDPGSSAAGLVDPPTRSRTAARAAAGVLACDRPTPRRLARTGRGHARLARRCATNGDRPSSHHLQLGGNPRPRRQLRHRLGERAPRPHSGVRQRQCACATPGGSASARPHHEAAASPLPSPNSTASGTTDTPPPRCRLWAGIRPDTSCTLSSTRLTTHRLTRNGVVSSCTPAHCLIRLP
jgi:hypothetical protein